MRVVKVLCLSFALLITVASARFSFPEILQATNDEISPKFMERNDIESADSLSERQCVVEIKVQPKKVVGRCINLGETSSHGCMTDEYIYPFHPECMQK